SQNKFISLKEARANKLNIEWNGKLPNTPAFIGNKIFNDYPLAEIAEYIDWTPFFHSWEMKGSYPKIFSDPDRGVEAKKLFDEAQQMLKKIIKEKWLTANAVIGLYPAYSNEDDIYLLNGKNDKFIFHTLRQQTKKPGGQP